MKLASVAGVTPVSLNSVEGTTDELLVRMARIRGGDAERDPGMVIAAREAAEQAHAYRAGLLATVEHPAADPAILIAGVLGVDRRLDGTAAEELGYYLADAGGPDIRDITRATTARGNDVVIVERIVIPDDPRATGSGAQLQAVVVDDAKPRIAVFTLHSMTGRGWLELATLAGQLVAGMTFG
ncbi:MAG: hypothetical protein ACRDQB_04695 [Thermocrispum sp.]